MSGRVPKWYNRSSAVGAHYVAQPFTAGLASAYVDRANHLAGNQLPLVHCQHFGAGEASSGTYRFLYKASLNAKALLFVFVPHGRPSAGVGTIVVSGADAPSTQNVAQRTGDITTLADLNEIIRFRKVVTADAFGEHTYAVNNVRLHSVVVYEVPRTFLEAPNDLHQDRSFAYVNRVFSDDGGGVGRGWTNLLTVLRNARIDHRRHWTFFAVNGPSINPGVNSVYTTIWDVLRYGGRFLGSAADRNEMRFRFFAYVGSITGGTTWDIRLRDSTTTDTAVIAGVTATGWQPGTASLATGAAFQMEATAVESLVIEAQRTVSAGSLRIDGVAVIEQPDEV